MIYNLQFIFSRLEDIQQLKFIEYFKITFVITKDTELQLA
jgi:hypothetical protein